MAADALTSERVDVDLNDAIEACYERGWTDGLPVVPPTEDRVAAFLEAAGNQPTDVLGVVETRGRVITAEKAAINAVMAGCLPEYMPVVNAVIRAMTTPEFNWHGSIASTGGSAQLIVVGGPIAEELGVNHGVNLFGPGFRPNATIGRAVRLIIMNVTGGTPGLLDRSTFGFGGKYSFVIAEDEEASPWEPLHVQRGLDPAESAITVYAAHSPTQFIDHSSNTPGGPDRLRRRRHAPNGREPQRVRRRLVAGAHHAIPSGGLDEAPGDGSALPRGPRQRGRDQGAGARRRR